MNITINNKVIELKYSFRSLMIFEKIAGKSFTNVTGLTEILVFFYSVIISSDKDTTLSWDQFIDWLDSNPNVLTEFTTWLQNVMLKNNFIINNTDDDTEVKEVEEGN